MKRVADVALPKLAALVQRAGCLPALWAHARLAGTFPERKEGGIEPFRAAILCEVANGGAVQ